MSSEERTAIPSTTALVGEIVDEYGSVEAFCELLRRDLDEPTLQLPRVIGPMPPRRSQVAARPLPHRVRTLPPEPETRPIEITEDVEPVCGDDHTPAAVQKRRGLWRRMLDWFSPAES
ncbi:MAG: hypothetical protein J2P18_12695 [Nocardia sp.]|nr:hypothetical protein [Nocardia sp.]